MFFWGMTACSLGVDNSVFKEPAAFICKLIFVSYSTLETAGFPKMLPISRLHSDQS